MAKQTRAQRKKQKQHATPAPADIVDVVEDGASDVIEQDAVDAAADGSAESIEAGDTSAADAKAAAKEAKEQAKRVERAKKATQRAEAKKNKKERKGPKFFWKIIDYFKNVKVEMKRVVWPSRKEVGRMSLVVIVALVFFGVLIYVVDSVVVPLLDLYSTLGG